MLPSSEPIPDDLVRLAAEVACTLSAGQTVALAAELATTMAPRRFDTVIGLTAPPEVIAFTEAWVRHGSPSGVELALALRVAAAAVRTTGSYEKVELIHTGPGLPDIRRNQQALLEVVRGARSRLWVVSYVLFGVGEVLAALEERGSNGVEVNLLVDHLTGKNDSEKAAGWRALSARLRAEVPSCRVLVWPSEARPKVGNRVASLHAKCAIADGRQAFVSSANFTDAAMERNLEAGYLVTGGPSPRALDAYLSSLSADGTIGDCCTCR